MTTTKSPSIEHRKILIIKHGAFGDLIQATGALRDLHTAHPDDERVLLTTPGYSRMMARCPYIDRIIIDKRASGWRLHQHFALARTLRSENFCRVYDLQKSSRTRIYRRWLLPSVDWYGDKSDKRGESLRASFIPQLISAGVNPAHCDTPSVEWMANDMRRFLRTQDIRIPFVVLVVGSAKRHPHKRWPHFAQLATQLGADYQVVTVPGPDEMDLASTLPAKLLKNSDRCLDWFELAGILKEAAFVVGNDTGPSHLASALGCAGIALFGRHTHSSRTGIATSRFHAIDAPDLAALKAETVMEHIQRSIPLWNAKSSV
ncbi:MAG: glycosyltransferase family 9 protein [Lysobacteraceae bacterium]